MLLPAAVLALAATATACLHVQGEYNFGCTTHNGWMTLTDNGQETCSGNCDDENNCTLNCIGGYSAHISNMYGLLAYGTPHGSYTQALKPDSQFYCCIMSQHECEFTGWTTRLDQTFFGC